MSCKIHIYLLNDLYSQELADAEHEGNQSIDNIKYEWEDELSISSDVTSVKELTDVIYPLAGMKTMKLFNSTFQTCVFLKSVHPMHRMFSLVLLKALFRQRNSIKRLIVIRLRFS